MLILNYPTKPRHNPVNDETLAYFISGLPDRSLAMELTRQKVYKLRKKL